MKTLDIKVFHMNESPGLWRGKYRGSWITSDVGREPAQVLCSDAGEAQKALAEIYHKSRKIWVTVGCSNEFRFTI